jgi:hypothetical protein
VVAHKAIGVDPPSSLLTSRSEGGEEFLAIDVVQEYIVAAIPAAHHMVNRSRILDAYLSWHGGNMGTCQTRSKEKMNQSMG